MTVSHSVTITSTGRALPSRLIDAEAVRRMVPAALPLGPDAGDTAWSRYWCAAHESTVDLAEEAALQALERAGLTAADIDLLVVATDTPEYILPATAAVLQERLEMRAVPAFDLTASGDGFLPALEVVRGYLAGASAPQRALLVGASTLSKYLDGHDHRTVPYIGDGAGALLLEVGQRDNDGDGHRTSAGAPVGVLGSDVRTSARDVHTFGIFAGGSRTPVTHAVIDAGIQNRLRWTGPMPPPLPVEACADQLRALLARFGLEPAMVQHWLWAQIGDGAVAAIMEALGEEMARVHSTRSALGFTGSACTPLTLDDAVTRGLLATGDVVVLAGAGAGRDLCATVVRWG
ncbi:MAG: hypothetical protein LW840_03550 [Gemmatimonas sp.]|jgi:3-oxoacyl-[acyl-carrier-protein] synthase-3|uniref:3-oxoacyl-ACP synthase III family protein n=1 Tax=Gemmatimonas sp. TaxID=1962908 RepID=UPI0025C6CA62|nr:3-oxoacyl-[acyl-carrier-protein] synthase III C-terminal domain-containing protein [Gemmatimonas sp.]MCE2952758.1 hypothetical protein [Gemmatimonas sp.]